MKLHIQKGKGDNVTPKEEKYFTYYSKAKTEKCVYFLEVKKKGRGRKSERAYSFVSDVADLGCVYQYCSQMCCLGMCTAGFI